MPLGINIVSYYAPTIFQESLGMSQERALFIGCWLQVFYFVASFGTVCVQQVSHYVHVSATELILRSGSSSTESVVASCTSRVPSVCAWYL